METSGISYSLRKCSCAVKGSREELRCEGGPSYFTVRMHVCRVMATLSSELLNTARYNSCLAAAKEQFLPFPVWNEPTASFRTAPLQWLPVQRAM